MNSFVIKFRDTVPYHDSLDHLERLGCVILRDLKFATNLFQVQSDGKDFLDRAKKMQECEWIEQEKIERIGPRS